MNVDSTVQYLIQFLLGSGNEKLAVQVQYIKKEELKATAEKNEKKLLIIQSDFFMEEKYGKKQSIPRLPLRVINNIPFLYGEEKEEFINGNFVLYADLIASAYYFLTRYEEMVLSECRDCYGNFPARQSLLFQAGLLERPIVDEYAEYIKYKLQILDYKLDVSERNFHTIFFTHDVDVPFEKFNALKVIKTVGKGLVENKKLLVYPVLNFLGFYHINPRDNFSYMLRREKEIKDRLEVYCESICFIIAALKDHPYNISYIQDKKTESLLIKLRNLGSKFGLHTSYLASEDTELLKTEKKILEIKLGEAIFYNRNHYLRQIHPQDMKHYINIGITDDFTAGYNEMPGFRLGTSRAVKWINPENGQVSNLMLHPLQIMDSSLDGKKPYQLELTYSEAFQKCKAIIDKVQFYRGELCILWHNGTFSSIKCNYQKALYDSLLDYILMKASKTS